MIRTPLRLRVCSCLHIQTRAIYKACLRFLLRPSGETANSSLEIHSKENTEEELDVGKQDPV